METETLEIKDGNQLTHQFEEWNTLFELQSQCKNLGFSELEIHSVLSNRFELKKRKVFINGAKYMAERMYSEEDIKLAFEHGILFSKESVSLCKEDINTEYELFIQNIKNQTK
jgi:hypothetical protein